MKYNFSKISDILNESVLTSRKFGQAIDKCMFFGFWKNIVGKKFEKISIPYDFKGAILLVSVMSPVVLQEMSFFKKDIIEKCAPYAEGLNLKVLDIKFDYKNWLSVKNASGTFDLSDTNSAEFYNEEDIAAVNLEPGEEERFKELKASILNIEFLPENLKEKIFNNALKQYKAQKLRKSV